MVTKLNRGYFNWPRGEDALKNLLSHPTIASKRWVWQQYDHMVMSGCKIEPGSDAGVVRLSIAGIDKYLAIANDCMSFITSIHIKVLQIAFVECMRNLACSCESIGGHR